MPQDPGGGLKHELAHLKRDERVPPDWDEHFFFFRPGPRSGKDQVGVCVESEQAALQAAFAAWVDWPDHQANAGLARNCFHKGHL